jgi:hypothetical protein
MITAKFYYLKSVASVLQLISRLLKNLEDNTLRIAATISD